MNYWNEIYAHFDPVAFSAFGINVHWYGIMYVLALLTALFMAKYFVKKDGLGFSDKMLDRYFIWVEVGVILGARLGYIAIYSGEAAWYFSYHGAVVGFVIATVWFCKKFKTDMWALLDLVALSVPLGYFFGRVGNFLNQELFGRETSEPWGILVGGALRHPSQLYEAVLEGLVIFVILFFYRKFKKFNGELICLYAMLYTAFRFFVVFFRQPDDGLGFVFLNLSMGQILSLVMFLIAVFLKQSLKKKLICRN